MSTKVEPQSKIFGAISGADKICQILCFVDSRKCAASVTADKSNVKTTCTVAIRRNGSETFQSAPEGRSWNDLIERSLLERERDCERHERTSAQYRLLLATGGIYKKLPSPGLGTGEVGVFTAPAPHSRTRGATPSWSERKRRRGVRLSSKNVEAINPICIWLMHGCMNSTIGSRPAPHYR